MYLSRNVVLMRVQELHRVAQSAPSTHQELCLSDSGDDARKVCNGFGSMKH